MGIHQMLCTCQIPLLMFMNQLNWFNPRFCLYWTHISQYSCTSTAWQISGMLKRKYFSFRPFICNNKYDCSCFQNLHRNLFLNGPLINMSIDFTCKVLCFFFFLCVYTVSLWNPEISINASACWKRSTERDWSIS